MTKTKERALSMLIGLSVLSAIFGIGYGLWRVVHPYAVLVPSGVVAVLLAYAVGWLCVMAWQLNEHGRQP